MVCEKSVNIEDGASETLLGDNEEEQLTQKEEVQFITAAHNNGDDKINFGGLEMSFTGTTEGELMPHANNPFRVRLRWVFIILFWALLMAMLIGGMIMIVNLIMIYIGAPKCDDSPPMPVRWYNRGPLIILNDRTVDPNTVQELKTLGAKGVIYELPSDETYLIGTPSVDYRIKELVAAFNASDINVILDITANYVSANDSLFQQAVEDEAYRSAFIFASGEVAPNNWLSKVNGSAWEEFKPKQYVLRQFGPNRYDLQLNDTLAKDKLKLVLKHIAKLGVRCVRFANAKHFIIDRALTEEIVNPSVIGGVRTDYDSWTHNHTTNQPGLRNLFSELTTEFMLATEFEGILSVTDHLERRFFPYMRGFPGLSLPVFGLLPLKLARSGTGVAKELHNELIDIVEKRSWVQWQYAEKELESSPIGMSEYNMFIMLLRGTPVAHAAAFRRKGENATSAINEINALRDSGSYRSGNFAVYTDASETVIAYTRSLLNSCTPGYLVVYNPSDAALSSDFSKIEVLPEYLAVNLISQNYNIDNIVKNVKVKSSSIPIAAKSVIILTYVPTFNESMWLG